MSFKSRAANANSTVIPLAVAVPPSGHWDGNDGKWSTFLVNVGSDGDHDNGQNFRVLASTSSSVTQIPLQAGWCNADCAGKRGVEFFNARQSSGFNTSQSSGWNLLGNFDIKPPVWWSDVQVNASYGTDNVGLGLSSATANVVPNNLIAAYTVEQYFMGSLGLGLNPTSFGGDPTKTFLDNYKASGLCPSLSYGFTAGASYRKYSIRSKAQFSPIACEDHRVHLLPSSTRSSPRQISFLDLLYHSLTCCNMLIAEENGGHGSLASLVLGGYDQSRFRNLGSSMKFDNQSLVVGVQSIIYNPDASRDTGSFSFTADSRTGFFAAIDSTLPYLWLPDHICDQFADKFQLTYDKNRNMYTVNDSAHNFNIGQNAVVNFRIGRDVTNSKNYTNIALPYAAFDLEASSPIFDNTTKYFPIRKSPNGIYALGRTFLQEAYIIVDYERFNLTILPALPADSANTKIVNIPSTSFAPPSSSPTSSGHSGRLAPGAIAGIVVGILALLGIIALGGYFFWRRRRDQEHRAELEGKGSDIDTIQAGEQVKHRRVSELDSNAPGSPRPSVAGYYGNRDRKDGVPIPPLTEMETPPAELYSPPPESLNNPSAGTPGSERSDYFIAGNKVRRRGATRESSGNNTPATPGMGPIAELPGDDGRFTVDGQHFDPVASPKQSPLHSRGPSDTSLQTNIDEVISGTHQKEAQGQGQERGVQGQEGEETSNVQRRPSHARDLSNTTIQSDSTAVSEPTPEEVEAWAASSPGGPRRPLSE